MSGQLVRVLVTSAGNEFMVDIASQFTEGFRSAGVTCELAIDSRPIGDPAVLELMVAPHEFIPLFLSRELQEPSLDRAIASTYFLNVEQPGSAWFEEAAHFGRLSRGIFDINPDGAAELRHRGLDAIHVPLGIAGQPALQLPPIQDRPIDILFLGHSSLRREQFFASHGEIFSGRRCQLLFVDVARPRQAHTPGYVAAGARSALLAQSRILLNLHSAERTYFERHRALMALSHGCALVTETSTGTDPLQNGRHFVMAPVADLAFECDRLLSDLDRLQAIATAGSALASAQMRTVDGCRTLLAHAAQMRDAQSIRIEEEAARSGVRARLADSLGRRSSGDRDWTIDTNPASDTRPAVSISVVITLFNYGRYLRECVQSVLSSEPPDDGYEIVIVDDASTDDSAVVASELIAESTVPATLVQKRFNTGLADARNIGVAEARGEFILTLDADNWIYHSCLRELQQAMRANGVAAAYPILRCFQDPYGESAGLLSLYPWSARELVRAPYIDALAMFRRDALNAVGGYSTELIDHGWFGWEDYDLWLKLAEAGHACVQVPAVLAAYRVHEQSMIRRTNRDTKAIARHLSHKFAQLEQMHPGLDKYFGFPSAGTLPVVGSQSAYDELQAWKTQCRNLENQVRELHDSRSWRVTAPLRFAYRMIKWPLDEMRKTRS